MVGEAKVLSIDLESTPPRATPMTAALSSPRQLAQWAEPMIHQKCSWIILEKMGLLLL